MLKKLLVYSFSPIGYDFNKLTDEEKKIFKTEENFKKFLKKYM